MTDAAGTTAGDVSGTVSAVRITAGELFAVCHYLRCARMKRRLPRSPPLVDDAPSGYPRIRSRRTSARAAMPAIATSAVPTTTARPAGRNAPASMPARPCA